jgi:hypothetical protein
VALETGETLRKALGLTGPAPPCQIDNMTASGQLCIRSDEYLDLDKLRERAKRNSYKASVEFVRFNVERSQATRSGPARGALLIASPAESGSALV